MSEILSAKYYQERLQKKLVKDIKICLKKENEKEQQYGCEGIEKKRYFIIIRNIYF